MSVFRWCGVTRFIGIDSLLFGGGFLILGAGSLYTMSVTLFRRLRAQHFNKLLVHERNVALNDPIGSWDFFCAFDCYGGLG